MNAQDYPADVADFMRAEVAAGHYADEQAVVVAGLRVLQTLKQQHEELRREIQLRIAQADAGVSVPLDREAFRALCAQRLQESTTTTP